MVEIVRPDGPLRASFDECERLLHRAHEKGLFNDIPTLERNLRHLRLVFDTDFLARFADNAPLTYETSDGELEAQH
jgi:hypothetical protein